ncbi:hypothetical protein A9Q99_14870 [Gammaproteobacteria bacterium 45_16_T64]|nr:hypothetical protein A9Q99_14870 [Gammaproteobacteria bacterium 45_16_T64]
MPSIPFLLSIRRLCLFLLSSLLPLFAPNLYGATLSDNTLSDNPLADYVLADDPYFQWKIIEQIPFNHGIEYRISMTSQRWQPESTPQHPVWRHDLSLYVPNKRTQQTALLFITGKNNNSVIKSSQYFSSLATHTQSITAQLFQVPNQPTIFKEDAEQHVRYEDSIVAYSWAQALENGDPTNIVLFPMVKSAYQAMNSIAEVAKHLDASSTAINQFVLSGASKRGWTTWLTAAIDPRVVGIVPLVIDVLNIQPSMAHHKQAYQQYSSAIQDYVREGIMSALEKGTADDTAKMIDPLSYKNTLAMPKFIVNASGDQFFLPDSSQFYLEQLLGDNYFRIIPNTDHSLNATAYNSLTHFYVSTLSKTPLPSVKGTIEQMPDIPTMLTLTLSEKPSSITLWHATNTQSRDFRVESIGEAWKATPWNNPPKAHSENTGYRYEIPIDKNISTSGWHAIFAEVTFTSSQLPDTPLTLTTQVRVLHQ